MGHNPDRFIDELREGKNDAFKALYETHGDRMYRTALRIVGGEADAADVVQEAFLIIARRIDRFEGRSTLSTWIYRITVNAALDRRRRMSTSSMLSMDQLLAEYGERVTPASPDDSPSDRAERTDLQRQVQRGIAALKPKLAAVTALRYADGMAYEEIARTLDCSIGTVKSRLSRAHAKLMPLLEQIYTNHFENKEQTDEL